MSNKIKFHTGDEVAHVDNIKKKISVEEVVFANRKLAHILCWWWEDDKKETLKAHSGKLVPWSIAEQGQDYVDSYLQSIEMTKKSNEMSKYSEHYNNERS